MTLVSTLHEKEYDGDGTKTAFAIPFYFARDKNDSNVFIGVVVYVDDVVATGVTITRDGDTGGTATFLTAPADGVKIKIIRETPITQKTDYVTPQTIYVEEVEASFNKVTAILQEHENQDAGHTADVTQLQGEIDANKATSDAGHASNLVKITENTSSITALTAKVDVNDTFNKIQQKANEQGVAANAVSIAANSADIDTAEGNINSLFAQVSANDGDIASANTKISDNATAISNLATLQASEYANANAKIASNKQDGINNAAEINLVKADVQSHDAQLTEIVADQTGQDTQIAALDAAIESLIAGAADLLAFKNATYPEMAPVLNRLAPYSSQVPLQVFNSSIGLTQTDTLTTFNQVKHYGVAIQNTIEFTLGEFYYTSLGYKSIMGKKNFILKSEISGDDTGDADYFRIDTLTDERLNPDETDPNNYLYKITLTGTSFSQTQYPDTLHTGVYNDPNVADSTVIFTLIESALVIDKIGNNLLANDSVHASNILANAIQQKHYSIASIPHSALMNAIIASNNLQANIIGNTHVIDKAITIEKLSDSLQQDAKNVELNSAVGMFNNSRFEYLLNDTAVNAWNTTPSDGEQLAPEIFMMNIGATPSTHSPLTPAHLQYRVGRHISGFTGSRHYFTIARTSLADPSFTTDGVVGFKRRITANELNESLFGTTLAGDLTLKMSYYNNNPSGVIGIKLKDYRNRKALWRVIPMNTPDLAANVYHTITEIIEPHQIESGVYGAQEGDVTSLELMIAFHGQGRYTNQWTGQITNEDGVIETVTQDVPPSWYDEAPDVNEFYSLSPHLQTVNQFYSTRLDMGRGRDVTRINDKSSDLQRRGIEERNKILEWSGKDSIGVVDAFNQAHVYFNEMIRPPTITIEGYVSKNFEDTTHVPTIQEVRKNSFALQDNNYDTGYVTGRHMHAVAGFKVYLDASKQAFVA